MEGEKKVLSYEEVVLRESDVALLRRPAWLNDQVIAFYFAYLRNERFLSLHSRGEAATLDPSVAYLLANAPLEMAREVLEQSGANGASILLLAVNNNPDAMRAQGGSHWSLLLLWDKAFFHLDSHRGTNLPAARRLARAISPSPSSPATAPPVKEVPECPQQQNAHDCGAFVLSFAVAALRGFNEGLPLPTALHEECARCATCPLSAHPPARKPLSTGCLLPPQMTRTACSPPRQDDASGEAARGTPLG